MVRKNHFLSLISFYIYITRDKKEAEENFYYQISFVKLFENKQASFDTTIAPLLSFSSSLSDRERREYKQAIHHTSPSISLAVHSVRGINNKRGKERSNKSFYFVSNSSLLEPEFSSFVSFLRNFPSFPRKKRISISVSFVPLRVSFFSRSPRAALACRFN